MYNWRSGAFHTQNGGLDCSTGATSCPPRRAHRFSRETPYQRRLRASNRAYHLRITARLRHSSSGVPEVPLVPSRHMRRRSQSSATKARRVAAQGVLLENRPVLQIFPGSPVAETAPFRPMLAVVGHTGGRAMQYKGEPVVLPGLPARACPMLARDGILDEGGGFRSVPRPAKSQAAGRGCQGAQRAGQAVVEAQRRGVHCVPPARVNASISAMVWSCSRPRRRSVSNSSRKRLSLPAL